MNTPSEIPATVTYENPGLPVFAISIHLVDIFEDHLRVEVHKDPSSKVVLMAINLQIHSPLQGPREHQPAYVCQSVNSVDIFKVHSEVNIYADPCHDGPGYLIVPYWSSS